MGCFLVLVAKGWSWPLSVHLCPGRPCTSFSSSVSQPEKRNGKLQLRTVQFAGIRSISNHPNLAPRTRPSLPRDTENKNSVQTLAPCCPQAGHFSCEGLFQDKMSVCHDLLGSVKHGLVTRNIIWTQTGKHFVPIKVGISSLEIRQSIQSRLKVG